PISQLVDLGSLAGDVPLVAARQILAELPDANGARIVVEVVLGDQIAVTEVGVAGGRGIIKEDSLRTGLQIDDAVVLAVAAVDVLLDHQIPSALVDLALVVVALGRDERRARRAAVVERDATELLVAGAVLDGRRMHVVVAARVHLPDHAAGAEQALDVVDVAHRVRHHVVTQHAPAVTHVERGRLARAEIPALAGGPAIRAVRREERAPIAGLARSLVVAEKRRAAAALAAIEAEEHEQRVAADVIVDVAPVGIPH